MVDAKPMNHVTRRSLLTLTGAGVLAACSAPRQPMGEGSATTPTAGSPTSSAVTTLPTPSTALSALPSKADTIRSFTGRKPTAWGLNLPHEVTALPTRLNAVALTFDACGAWRKGESGSGYDSKLIELLRRNRVKATLFLNARWVAANESIARELAADPLFQLSSHGVRHEPLSVNARSAYGIKGTKDLGAMYEEIVGPHAWLADHAPKSAMFFRSGTAFSDDVGVAMCNQLGIPFVGFTNNSDAGATLPAAMVAKELQKVRPGDIVIGHMNHPGRGTAAGYAQSLPELLDQGVRFVHVSEAAPPAPSRGLDEK